MPDFEIEIARGRMSEERADQILRFWSSQGALEGDAARRRLPEVVCVLLDGDGEIAGVNSVYPESVALIGGRRFWVYRRLLLPTASEMEAEMVNAAFTALEEEFEPSGDGPVGLYVPISDRAEMERHPEAIRPDTELIYAGYLDDGTQARIRYFDEAAIGPGLPSSRSVAEGWFHDFGLEDHYRIQPFSEAGDVTHDDVLALWEREGVVRDEEADRRVHEVDLVAVEEADGLVGVSTAYLGRNSRLRMDLWHYRTFVASAHRKSNLAIQLAFHEVDLLGHRFVTGEDTRAPGIIFEIENEGLKNYLNKALWPQLAFFFMGENERSDHVRVHYFSGSRVPIPDSARAEEILRDG